MVLVYYSKIFLSNRGLTVILRKQLCTFLYFSFWHFVIFILFHNFLIFLFHWHLCWKCPRCLFDTLHRNWILNWRILCNRLLNWRGSYGLSSRWTCIFCVWNLFWRVKHPMFISCDSLFPVRWLNWRLTTVIWARTIIVWIAFVFNNFLFCFVAVKS
jgi:hypothetical protein